MKKYKYWYEDTDLGVLDTTATRWRALIAQNSSRLIYLRDLVPGQLFLVAVDLYGNARGFDYDAERPMQIMTYLSHTIPVRANRYTTVTCVERKFMSDIEVSRFLLPEV